MPMGSKVHTQLICFTCRICPLLTFISYVSFSSGITVKFSWLTFWAKEWIRVIWTFCFSLYSCCQLVLSVTCIEVSGSPAKDVANQLKVHNHCCSILAIQQEQEIVSAGDRESELAQEGERIHHHCDPFGGVCIG